MRFGTGGGGRDDEFEKLYRKYFPRTYRFFRQAGVADDEAQDLAQQTFTRIYETFEAYRGGGWSYVGTTARRVLLNRVRGMRRGKRDGETVSTSDDQRPVDIAAPEGRSAAEIEIATLRRNKLRTAIAVLPDAQRECLQLWLTDMKYEAVAKTLGITVDAVKSRLRDAKRTLRDRLGETFPEDFQ